MADDSKKDIKGNNNIADTNTDASKPSASQSTKDSKTVDVPVTAVDGNKNKGGEQIMAKDPEGMFDYSKAQPYTVKDGESLFDVAQKNSVALQQLRYFNHLDKATWRVKSGQTLYIPSQPIHVPVGE